MMVIAAVAAFSPVVVAKAYAFKLFGMTIFGEDQSESEQVPDPVRYSADLSVKTTDADLKKALEDSSRLISDKDRPVSGDLGIVVKARDDRDRLIATLFEHARYGGVVTITVNGKNIDDLPPNPTFDRSKPIPVHVEIDPGPVFRVREVQFGGDAANRNPADYDLAPGQAAGSLAIISAGDKIVEQLKSESRPLAKLTTRKVIADHRTSTVDVVIAAEGGPVAPIGDVGVTGEKSVKPIFIQRYSRLERGEAYSPEALKQASERLRALGVFSSVTILQADSLAGDGTLPMTIEVSEGKQRYFGVGANYSTIDGLGVQGYWGHRNLFGEAESLRIEGSVGRFGENDISSLDYSAGILFTKPGAFVPEATLKAGIVAKTENPDPYNASLITASLGLSYELSSQDTVSASGEISYEKDDDDAFASNEYLTFALPLTYERDARDNKFNPTAGYRATLQATPSYEALDSTIYSSFEGSITGYRAIGAEDNVVFAGKLAAGSLIGGELEQIAATRRFYAGGGGSVRGYGFQEISPRNDNGDETGGKSYVTASLEARVRITDTIGVVPFIDVGTVGPDEFPDFSDIRTGAGVGIRYATPFGPLRLDFAVPLNKYEDGASFGIYAGIGQSF